MMVELTPAELDLLLHFAEIGQSHVYVRNNYGDREVAEQLEPVLRKLATIRQRPYLVSTHEPVDLFKELGE